MSIPVSPDPKVFQAKSDQAEEQEDEQPPGDGLLSVSCEQGFGSGYEWVALRGEVGVSYDSYC